MFMRTSQSVQINEDLARQLRPDSATGLGRGGQMTIQVTVHPGAGIDLETGRPLDRIEIVGGEDEDTDVAVVAGERDEILGVIVAREPVDEETVRAAVLRAYGDCPVITIGWPDGGNEMARATEIAVVLTLHSGRRLHGYVTVTTTPEETAVQLDPPVLEEILAVAVTDERLTNERREHLSDVLRWAGFLSPAPGKGIGTPQ
jgi:hypothetical protein